MKTVNDKLETYRANGSHIVTWKELSCHCTESNCWIAVRDRVYDVSKWIKKHPGGVDTIALNAGRDATQLFEAYHPCRVFAMLDAYYVGELESDPSHPRFPEMSKFYRELKRKIEKYFSERNMSARYAPEMLLRTFALIGLVLALHTLSIVVLQYSGNISYALVPALLSGLVFALLCFMPVHEGSHASTTDSPFVWRLLGAIHDFLLGASFYTWCHQHFLGHHPFTNLSSGNDPAASAIDPDIVTNDPDLRRIKSYQRWFHYYRFQKFYAPLLYGLLGLKFRINDISIMFFSKKNGSIPINPPNTWHWTCFIAGKLFFLFYRIVLPSFYISVWQSFVLFLFSDLVTSYILAFVFQVNHVVEHAKFLMMDKKTGNVNMDWAEMQVRTTIDYAHESWWTTFLTGALNYQVTHHLFPYVSQVHYMEIAPIIVEHCKEYDIPYTVLPSFWDALKAHFHYLDIMGHSHADF